MRHPPPQNTSASSYLMQNYCKLFCCPDLQLIDLSGTRHCTLVSVQTTFSTAEKRRQALLRARNELVSFLRALLMSSADHMGEPTKETEEEMQERAQRMRAQVLHAFASLVGHFPTAVAQSNSSQEASPGPSDAGNGSTEAQDALEAAAKQMNEPLQDLWRTETFWKYPLDQHPDIAVWAAWFSLVSTLSVHQPRYLAPAADVLAPLVYASFRNAPEGVSEAAWAAVNRFTGTCPAPLKDAAVFKKLAGDVASQMGSGCVTLSGLMPLGLQLLKHAPGEWGGGELQALWLPALLRGFKKNCSAAPPQVAGAEQCAQGLVEVLAIVAVRSTGSESETQAVAQPLLKEMVGHASSDIFARGLWYGAASPHLLLISGFLLCCARNDSNDGRAVSFKLSQMLVGF